jgi:hypothetical protein
MVIKYFDEHFMKFWWLFISFEMYRRWCRESGKLQLQFLLQENIQMFFAKSLIEEFKNASQKKINISFFNLCRCQQLNLFASDSGLQGTVVDTNGWTERNKSNQPVHERTKRHKSSSTIPQTVPKTDKHFSLPMFAIEMNISPFFPKSRSGIKVRSCRWWGYRSNFSYLYRHFHSSTVFFLQFRFFILSMMFKKLSVVVVFLFFQKHLLHHAFIKSNNKVGQREKKTPKSWW